MASKSTGKEDAVRDFEEWRKSKASVSTSVAQTETSADSVEEESRVQKKSELTETEKTSSAVVAKTGAKATSFAKSVAARIGVLFARKEKTEAAEKQTLPAQTKTEPTAPLPVAKATGSLAGLRSKVSEASPRAKKITLVSIVVGAVVVIFIALFAKFEFVTVDAGIETTLGEAQGTTFLVEKANAALQNDLVVVVQPGGVKGDAETLMVGTVFSFNQETYALYDGEVIWQIPLSELKGKVLFATATQVIP